MKKLLLILLCLPLIGFGQSKKKQIESLKLQLDSINYLMDVTKKILEETKQNYNTDLIKFKAERFIFKNKVDNHQVEINDYKDKLYSYENEIISLNYNIDSLNSILANKLQIIDSSVSQNNNFLTKLFLEDDEIKNQDFSLKLIGVINTKAQIILNVNERYNNDYMSEVLYLHELKVAQQFKSEENLGKLTPNWSEFKEKCTWNWTGNNPNLKMVSTYSLDYFPTFSFLKGKLLTITDGSSSKDYLFSTSKSSEYSNYGHKKMQFNLTDDNEKGYIINTIIIDEQSYIILDKSIMQELGFKTKFTNSSQFKIFRDGVEDSYLLKSEDEYNFMRQGSQKFMCKCDSNYLTLFRQKTKYMNKDFNLNQEDLNYLFKFIEK